MEQKIQILDLCDGGHTFANHDDYIEYLRTRSISIDDKVSWKGEYLRKELPECKIIQPRMPCQDDAKYEEWKTYYERFFEVLDDEIILMGSSLGGIFLAKYLSENKVPKKIIHAYIICPPFDDKNLPVKSLADFQLQDDLTLIEKQCEKVTFMFSKDDEVIPLYHYEKYKEKLPNCEYIVYESKGGHFQVKEFPEIIEMIKEDIKNV